MKKRNDGQILGPAALALLQSCLDTLLTRHDLSRDSEDANTIAAALIEAYNRGITDRKELIRLADIAPDLRRFVGTPKPAAVAGKRALHNPTLKLCP